MVLVQRWPFLELFFQEIQARKMSFRIFQSEKTSLKAIKTSSPKSRKIDLSPKGLTDGFGPKMTIFRPFFLGNIVQGNVFYDILERKDVFLGYKRKNSKSRKINIFPKGLTHRFGSKMAIFPTFFFRQYRPEKCLSRYSRVEKRLSRL